MEEDVLDMYLNSSDTPFVSKEEPKVTETNTEEKKSFVSKGQRDDVYNDNNIKKLDVDPSKFKKSGKTFTIVMSATPDEDSQKVMAGIVKNLAGRGFTFRYLYSDATGFYKTLTDIEGVTVEAYRPWRKMAPELANVVKISNTRLAYQYAASFASKFNSFPPAVRCIRANGVSSLLGKDLDNPSNFLLAWTECGTEVITKDTDFKKIGNCGMFFTMCKALNIPVFNIKNKESIQKLAEYLKSIQ